MAVGGSHHRWKRVCKQEASTGKVCAACMAAGGEEQRQTGGLNQLAQIGGGARSGAAFKT